MLSEIKRITCQPVWERLCPEWKIVPGPEPECRIELFRNGAPVLRCGESTEFQIRYLRSGKPVAGIPLQLTLTRDFHEPERLDIVSALEPYVLTTRLERPGFVRLAVSGGDAASVARGTGYEPERIEAAPDVDGFDAFWQQQLAALDRVPPRERLLEPVELSDPAYDGVDCFDVQLDCPTANPVSGYLALPRHAAPHSLPGYVFFHGAGVRPAFQPLTWASRGMIGFNVNALGLPNRAGKEFFQRMLAVDYDGYPGRFYDSPEQSLFRDMTLRAVQAVRYLRSRPEWDGRILVAHGGSQGGFQALAAAALAEGITLTVANAPAMCNLGGALDGRTPSWPHTVIPGRKPEWIRSARFFDGAAFARRSRCEAVLTVGFSDSEAVPSSVYAAHQAHGGICHLREFPELGHETEVFWSGEAEIFEHIRQMRSL